MKRLLNQQADIRYLQQVLDGLPESDLKLEVATYVIWAKNDTKPSPFTDTELRKMRELGVDTSILSEESVANRVGSQKKTHKQNKKSGTPAWVHTLIVWGLVVVAAFSMMYWNGIRAFFATTPQAKCEVYISSEDKDSYCTEDGEKKSHKKDRLTQEKSKCLSRSPYFEWTGEATLVDGYCTRVMYESRQACIDDGKQGVRSIRLPADEGGGSEIVGTRCLDDGTWEAYDPEYEDYKQQQVIEAGRTTCVDTTSHDYNWNNDMLCTRPDGSQFYTSYEGARGY